MPNIEALQFFYGTIPLNVAKSSLSALIPHPLSSGSRKETVASNASFAR
jgi:hypothetical protein